MPLFEGIENDEYDVVIDVRTRAEWESGHIEGATLVENLASTGTPDNIMGCQNCTLAVYCRTGVRAGQAIERLQETYGFSGTLYNGLGVSDWQNAGYPLVETDSVTPPCQDPNCGCSCPVEEEEDENNSGSTEYSNRKVLSIMLVVVVFGSVAM